MPAAGVTTVEAPSVENVIVDAPSVVTTERAVVDFADIGGVGAPEGAQSVAPAAEAVQNAAPAAEAVQSAAAAANLNVAAAPEANFAVNAQAPEANFSANTGYAQGTVFTPQQNTVSNQGFTGGYAQGNGFDQSAGFAQNAGYAPNQGFAPGAGYANPQMNSAAPGYMNQNQGLGGYDYGYNKDIQEYGEMGVMPEGYYSNDPFSSYYYEDDEMPKAKPNGKAIASLILGIVSLVTFYSCMGWIPGIIAIPLGITGINECRSKGMARAGMITGILGTVFGLFYLMYMIIDRIV